MTHVHLLPGLRTDSLLTYLASLGLSRVLAQGDPHATLHWRNETAVVTTSIQDIESFLVEDYIPTPVVSPWNRGSGYGAKDKSQKGALEALVTNGSERLRDYRDTHDAVLTVLQRADQGWEKEDRVQELRNWLPDRALDWMDAAVVLTTDEPAYPIILGTGGNDGRLEFSSNFHQRLADVLPELGAREKASRGWASDLLTGGATQPLKSAAIGQYDPLGAGGPGTSAFDETTSLVNPWAYVLMVEGATLFASSPARRIESSRSSRAAQPFTVNFSPDGPVRGAGNETARGEVWAPTWARPLRYAQIRQVFAQAKASWDGRTVVQAPHMYAAVRSLGVDRRVDAFIRFAIVQRNGLSFVAVAVDRVSVTSAPGIDVLIPIERRANSFHGGASARLGALRRQYESRLTAFARNADKESGPELLLQLLAAQTELELGFSRSQKARASVTRTQALLGSTHALDVLDPVFRAEPEARVAAALASGFYPAAGGPPRSLRALLVGQPPTRKDGWLLPAVAGYGVRPIVDVLADAAVWREQRSTDRDRNGAGRGVRYLSGHAYRPHWGDVHAWAGGRLDDARVDFVLKALLSLRWEYASEPLKHEGVHHEVVPELAILQVLASGRYQAPGGTEGETRQGVPRGWAVRLRAGQVGPVLNDATALVNRLRVDDGLPAERADRHHFVPPLPTTSGSRLLAALLACPCPTAATYLDGRFKTPQGKTAQGGEIT